MQRFLPVFPLELVVYPGHSLNLHIFEPRYKQLIADVMEQDSLFGIPPFFDKRVQEYGTVVKVTNIEKEYDNGELDIRTEGVGIFRVLELLKEVPDKLYSAAIISDLGEPSFDKVGIFNKVAEMVDELHISIGYEKPILKEYDSMQSFDLVKYINLKLDQQYELLTIKSEAQRQGLILEHLKHIIPSIQEAESLRSRIQANGYFRKEMPPEF